MGWKTFDVVQICYICFRGLTTTSVLIKEHNNFNCEEGRGNAKMEFLKYRILKQIIVNLIWISFVSNAMVFAV